MRMAPASSARERGMVTRTRSASFAAAVGTIAGTGRSVRPSAAEEAAQLVEHAFRPLGVVLRPDRVVELLEQAAVLLVEIAGYDDAYGDAWSPRP